MFDMESFNKELEEQNAALESLLSNLDDTIADESLLSSDTTIDDMLSAVKDRVDKCESADDCQKLLDKLNAEIKSFNDAMEKLIDASKKFKDDGDKQALKDTIKPVITDLKKKCNIIEMKDIDEDTDSIDDEEVKKLKDFLEGSRDIINDKMDLFDVDDSKGCCESFLDSLNGDELDIAEEGIKEAFQTVKRAVITWFENQIKKFKGLFNKEKDPKKKSILQKILGIFSRNKSKVNSAGNAEECKTIKEETADEVEKFYDDVFDSQYAKESFVNSPYDKMVDAAYEAYTIAYNDYQTVMESYANGDPAMEMGMGAIAAITIGSYVATYAAMIALLVKKYGNVPQVKYAKQLEKQYKPELKKLAIDLRTAKKKKDAKSGIDTCKKIMAIDDKILKELKSLGSEVEKSYSKDSHGNTNTKFVTAYTGKVRDLMDKVQLEKDRMNAQIKLFQTMPAKESFTDEDESFLAGYTAAMNIDLTI